MAPKPTLPPRAVCPTPSCQRIAENADAAVRRGDIATAESLMKQVTVAGIAVDASVSNATARAYFSHALCKRLTSQPLKASELDDCLSRCSKEGDESSASFRAELAARGDSLREIKAKSKAAKNSCVCCFAVDDDEMIQCDGCGEWRHYACAGVDAETLPEEEAEWLCDDC